MRNKLNIILEKLDIRIPTRKQGIILVFVFALIIILSGLLAHFSTAQRILTLTSFFLLSVIFVILWILAGILVFRSLITASVGLSFIIFLGQSYCSSSVLKTANDSLKVLISFGLAYVSVQFLFNLYKDLLGDKKSPEEWRQSGVLNLMMEPELKASSWIFVSSYLILLALFISQVYSVVSPIIKALCIY